VKIEENLMIQNTRVLRGEVETTEEPGRNEENPPLQKFPDNQSLFQYFF